MRKFKGNCTTPKGFSATGVMAGIRKKIKKDIALVYSETPCVAGATFTTNKVKAAPVVWDMEILKNGKPKHAVVLNSGIANACMGQQGVEDNYEMASAAALALASGSGIYRVHRRYRSADAHECHRARDRGRCQAARNKRERRSGRCRGDHDHRHGVQDGCLPVYRRGRD